MKSNNNIAGKRCVFAKGGLSFVAAESLAKHLRGLNEYRGGIVRRVRRDGHHVVRVYMEPGK